MKFRIKKYYQLGAPFYNIECFCNGSWLSVCQTTADDKDLAYVLKAAALKAIEDGVNVWFLNNKNENLEKKNRSN